MEYSIGSKLPLAVHPLAESQYFGFTDCSWSGLADCPEGYLGIGWAVAVRTGPLHGAWALLCWILPFLMQGALPSSHLHAPAWSNSQPSPWPPQHQVLAAWLGWTPGQVRWFLCEWSCYFSDGIRLHSLLKLMVESREKLASRSLPDSAGYAVS